MTDRQVSLIGLCGPIGSGKTTCAMELARLGFVCVRFAQPLKSMLSALGLTNAQLDGDEKETPCDLLCGQTPRHAMQTLGTEWGRHMIGAALWVNAWRRQVLDVGRSSPVVCDDVRFANEAELIRDLGGRVVRVLRPSGAPALANMERHISEALDFRPDITINNVGTVDDLLAAARALMVSL